MHKKPLLGLVALIVLGLNSISFAAPGVLRMGNGGEPKDVDPIQLEGFVEQAIVTNLFEGLAVFNPGTKKVEPGVAERWSQSKDGLVWTFSLRKNAKWSNGDPITAQDFVYSWTRYLDPQTASRYAFFAFFIKNGEKFNKGEIKDASQLGLKALNPSTFQVTLEQPTPYLEKLIFFATLSPVHKATVEKFGRAWSKPENFVSNGAYVLTNWEVNKVMRAKKNPHYWDAKRVSIETIEFHPIEDQHTEERMFRAGQLDVTWKIPAEKVPFWVQDKTGVYRGDPFMSTVMLKINITKAPFNDVRVRRALALAIDRTALVKHVTQGNEPPALAFNPVGIGGYTPKKYYAADLSGLPEAKKLLAEAGFKDGKGLSVELLYDTSDFNKKICEAVQGMWSKNLGIQVTIVNQEWKVYLDTQSKKQFQISRGRWVGDYDDPTTFLSLWTKGSALNHPGYDNPEYDSKLKALDNIADTKKRLKAIAEVEDILMKDMPIIPLYTEKRNFLIRPNVKGWSSNLLGVYPLKFVRLEGANSTQ